MKSSIKQIRSHLFYEMACKMIDEALWPKKRKYHHGVPISRNLDESFSICSLILSELHVINAVKHFFSDDFSSESLQELENSPTRSSPMILLNSGTSEISRRNKQSLQNINKINHGKTVIPCSRSRYHKVKK